MYEEAAGRGGGRMGRKRKVRREERERGRGRGGQGERESGETDNCFFVPQMIIA